ncbi:MAG TPA: tRNA (adenosine(37)-N6)-threonylcarbamoyltransferase complex transferase subunit TsaD [Rickettsiales bacterium]|nr:tRNA (adenosine(37)-N6)-threonylcarbamoyltransferase complex transferase subunit TsaD [Rickettsiales bacterium]
MIVLGIESSCDETAAALVTEDRRILSSVILSQTTDHAPYGGVVPEIAARSHITHIDKVVQQAFAEAGCSFADVDAIAATTGPGLIGGVIVGTMAGKAFASALNKPFIAVNHLEGHALTARLTDAVEFPYLLLLVSGGHCQVLVVKGVGQYEKLGGTLDDALGEAFDKVAKLLGLGYPGGPQVEERAKSGNPKRFSFPLPLKGREGCDFSFSGLKTAVRLAIQELGTLTGQDIADICASFQYSAGEVLKDRMRNAFVSFAAQFAARTLVVAGGVAANRYLRDVLESIAAKHGFTLTAPPLKLCTDNAAMIAWAGIERLKLGQMDSLETEPRARWPLTELQ